MTNDHGDVIALVLPEIGDGPLNAAVEGRPGLFAAVEQGASIWEPRWARRR